MIDLPAAQAWMEESRIELWLLYDFRGSNPAMAHLLGGVRPTTRRSFLLIPRQGEPKILVHPIDRELYADTGYSLESYTTWADLLDLLGRHLSGCSRIATEYSPGGFLPITSWIDGGTLDLLRSFGVEIVSSANLFQVSASAWSKETLNSHHEATRHVVAVKDGAFQLITDALRRGESLTEYDVSEWIAQQFRERGLETKGRAIVGVNAHSGDPHYEPTESHSTPIGKGDWVLIDLWAKLPGDSSVFSDITWVGYAGQEIPERHQAVFKVVKAAQAAVVRTLQEAWARGETLPGWQCDRAARDVIAAAGYANFFIHRTGHSLSPGPNVHGLGVNLDGFETHDTRDLLPGVGFTVEPGVYLPEFGVRLEINGYIDPDDGPQVTAPVQEEILRLG